MPHSYTILITTILVMLVLNPTKGNTDKPCKCHPPVGSVDAVYTLPNHLAGSGSVKLKVKIYFDYNKKLALMKYFGANGVAWRLYDGNKHVYYERKTNGLCIKYKMPHFPVFRCMPKEAEYFGETLEKGEIVDAWRNKTGPDEYRVFLLTRSTCVMFRTFMIPHVTDTGDASYQHFHGHLHHPDTFKKNVNDCLPEKPVVPEKKTKIFEQIYSKLLEIKNLLLSLQPL